MCLWPGICFGTRAASKKRSGLNSFASGPHNRDEVLMAWIGTVTSWPFATNTLSMRVPEAVVTGLERGMMSSCAAYVHAFVAREINLER